MKIGDYVRTRKGISKITFIEDEIVREIVYTDTKEVFEYYTDNKGKEIKDYWEKYSPNIIDLIEAGDYVNGKLVIEHAYQKGRLFVTNLYIGGKGFTTCEDYSWELTKENEDYIDSILTKEQFESMEYKVVE